MQPSRQIAQVRDRDGAALVVFGDGSREAAAAEVVLPCQVVGIDVEPQRLQSGGHRWLLQASGMHGRGTGERGPGGCQEGAEGHRQQMAPAPGRRGAGAAGQ